MEGKGITGKDGHVLESELAYEEGLLEASKFAPSEPVN
jgi:hypothetical protein